LDKCEYCGSPVADSSSGLCTQCGGHITTKPRDYTVCPNCDKKLLALASTVCNHCGKGLPDDYIQTRQRIAQTIADQTKRSPKNDELLSDETGMMTWLNTVSDIMRNMNQ